MSNLAKTTVMENMFYEFPEMENMHPYDFFMGVDVDESFSVEESVLGEEWGFETLEVYKIEDIQDVRGLMDAKLQEYEDLANKVLKEANSVDEGVVEDAKKWFAHYDMDVNSKDLGEGTRVYLNTGDDFNTEISKDELEYRAELWGEMEDDE